MSDYKQLFEAYVQDLHAARNTAQAWWEALLQREIQTGLDAAAAHEVLQARWPLGAVSHPAVIATFRSWALRVQTLNDQAELEEDDEEFDDDVDEEDWGDDGSDDEDQPEDLASLEAPVQPHELLIEMLPGRVDDLAEFMADFVFSPLGLDKDDRWV